MASPLRSGAFRFAMLVALVFALGSAVVLVIVEASIGGYAAEAMSDSVASEAAILISEGGNVAGLDMVRAIERHEAAMPERQHRYRLVDASGTRLAGHLPPANRRLGWYKITMPADETGDTGRIELVALGRRLGDGATLTVADDASDLTELRRSLAYLTIAAGAGITLLALIGGYFVGTLFLRRLRAMNGAVGRIMAGRLDERLPTIGMSVEFDELSVNLNRMLGRIETLVSSVRQVSTDIAHDLRTPMTRLRQRLETIEAASVGTGLGDEVAAALAQADEILAIFRALLRIGALEGATSRQARAPVDLSDIAERIFQVYRPFVEDQDQSIESAIEPEIFVEGDGDLLGQALTNLVENASAHTPGGTQIRIGLTRHADMVVLSVTDDGPGIPKDEHANVVRRFYRLDTSRNTPGTGLGLALVEAIALRHGAVLRLSDARPGLEAAIVFPPIGPPEMPRAPSPDHRGGVAR